MTQKRANKETADLLSELPGNWADSFPPVWATRAATAGVSGADMYYLADRGWGASEFYLARRESGGSHRDGVAAHIAACEAGARARIVAGRALIARVRIEHSSASVHGSYLYTDITTAARAAIERAEVTGQPPRMIYHEWDSHDGDGPRCGYYIP